MAGAELQELAAGGDPAAIIFLPADDMGIYQ